MAATDTPDDAALQDFISAWQGAREVDAFSRSAALAYAYTGKADQAYQLLGSLALNANDEPMAQWAQLWRSRLETGVTRADILAEMRRDPVSDVPFKEWTLDKESAMTGITLAAGTEDAQAVFDQQKRQVDRGAMPSGRPGAIGLP